VAEAVAAENIEWVDEVTYEVVFYLRAQTLVLTLDVSSQVLLVKGQDQDLVVSTLKVVVQVNDVLTVDKHFELLDPLSRTPSSS